jgi:Mg2+ and Co2+ transporter CorA
MGVETVNYGKVTWTNIEEPTSEDIEVLKRNFNFHPLNLEDCLRIERPKIDEYDDHLFIVMDFPVFDKGQRISRPSEVDFFIGANYLVTVHEGILKPIYQLFDDCQRYEQTRARHMGRGASRLLYDVIDVLVDFGDIADHLNKAWDILEDYREVIEGLSETSDSVSSYRINEVMRILTVISVIMLPLSLISGIYGMNVLLPGERLPFAFFAILGLMVAIAGGMLLYFKRRKWL